MNTLTRIWKWRPLPAVRPWIFPLILGAIVIVLSAASISGSSVGAYTQTLGTPDPNLLYGRPELVRSDEWLVATAMTVAQSRAHFPRINPNIGLGEDVSVILDVPYRDWSTLFRPQNWAFFVLPLSIAFAFKWWLLGVGVVIPLYFVILRFLPRRHLLAAMLSLTFIWSPFMQWWYQSITLAPVAFGACSLLVLMRLRTTTSKRGLIGLSLLLAYLIVCFGLVLYPPFQIVTAEVIAAVYVGFLLEHGLAKKRQLLPQGLALVGGLLVAGALLAAFVATRSQVIHAVINTVYPGHRVVASGGFGLDRLLSGFVSFRLQLGRAAAHYYTNQSEGSTFIFVWPFLIIPSLYAGVRRWQREHTVDWSLLIAHLVILFFLAHLFLNLSSPVTRLLGFSGILQTRTLLGIGLIALIQLVLVIRAGLKHPYPHWLAAAMAFAAVVVQIIAGLALSRHNPGYIPHSYQIVVLAAALGVSVGLILWGRLLLGVGLLLALNLFSVFYIHPLYHGLAPLTSTPLSRAMVAQEKRLPGPWIVLDNPTYGNYAISSGVPSYSGVYTYPQLPLWQRFAAADQFAYNRYGFAIFTTQPLASPITLIDGDTFEIHYDACAPQDSAIKHVVALTPVTSPCLALDQTIAYPKLTFYLYHLRQR